MTVVILRILQAIQFVLIYLFFKLENSTKRHIAVIEAIYKYEKDKSSKEETIEEFAIRLKETQDMWDSMEPLWATTLRGWEWRGYKNIVPADVYEKIKDYLRE